MPKKSARNNELLNVAKDKVAPQIYSLLLDLINNQREDIADKVMKIDYLLQYANTCIKEKDYVEAMETLDKARIRIDIIREEGADTEYLEYLYQGIEKKIRS